MRGSLTVIPLAAVVAGICITGCGSAMTVSRRTQTRLTSCLEVAGLHPTRSQVGNQDLERILAVDQPPRPVSIESAGGVAILSYHSSRQAAAAFASYESLEAMLTQGNTALIVEDQRAEPTAGTMGAIEHCALDDPHVAQISGDITDVPFPTPAPQPRCRLTASFSDAGAGAGSYFGVFAVRNLAPTRCGLYRYPKLTMLYGSGHPVPQPETHGENGGLSAKPYMLYLRGHQTTFFEIAFGLVGDSPPNFCTRRAATSVLISVGPDAAATAPLSGQDLGMCPGISVGAFGPL